MQELMEQVQIEYLPVDAKENGQHFEPGCLGFPNLTVKFGYDGFCGVPRRAKKVFWLGIRLSCK